MKGKGITSFDVQNELNSDTPDLIISFGNQGEKVRLLQEKLAYLGFLRPELVTGRFGDGTTDAVKAYQAARGLRTIGIANMQTQLKLNEEYERLYRADPNIWSVVEED